jgi:proteic killer suppression protein
VIVRLECSFHCIFPFSLVSRLKIRAYYTLKLPLQSILGILGKSKPLFLILVALNDTITAMIKTFKDKETEKIWNECFSKRLSVDIQRKALIKLIMINRAKNLLDLQIPPSNQLEKLMGDRAGQYSIRINKRWRICFVWNESNAFEVEIVDYH